MKELLQLCVLLEVYSTLVGDGASVVAELESWIAHKHMETARVLACWTTMKYPYEVTTQRNAKQRVTFNFGPRF